MKGANAIKLMLADDEPHILQFLELGLVNEGFEVKSAPDGINADYLIKPFSFDELLARIGARLRNQFPSLTGET